MFAESFSRNVELVIVLGSIDSLNVAVTGVPTLIPAEPSAGVFETIVGGVVSGVTLVTMSFWISVGAQRAVVDADLVDPAVEPLAPDAVAADAQRAGRGGDRARAASCATCVPLT